MNTSTSLQEKSRFNMVEQQIRPAGILDDKVLEAILHLARDAFVVDKYKNIAYADLELPIEIDGIAHQENMLVPRLEARFAQALLLKPTDTVLEIGTGSGFQAALLSMLCSHVTTVEIDSTIAQFAKNNLVQQQIHNVKVEVGDGQNGWGSSEYPAILVTGSLPSIPDALKYKLALGGRLVAVVGTGQNMVLVRITRHSPSQFSEEVLQETCIPPLRGTSVSRFTF